MIEYLELANIGLVNLDVLDNTDEVVNLLSGSCPLSPNADCVDVVVYPSGVCVVCLSLVVTL